MKILMNLKACFDEACILRAFEANYSSEEYFFREILVRKILIGVPYWVGKTRMEVFKVGRSYVEALRCRECGREFPAVRAYACNQCFGPLEVVYNADSIRLSKTSFEGRPRTIWRYRELLPINDWNKVIDLEVGYTPSVNVIAWLRPWG